MTVLSIVGIVVVIIFTLTYMYLFGKAIIAGGKFIEALKAYVAFKRDYYEFLVRSLREDKELDEFLKKPRKEE